MLEVGWSLFIVASLVVTTTPARQTILVMSRAIAQRAPVVVATAAGVFAELLAGWSRLLLKQGHDRCPVMLILRLRLALEKRD